MLRTRSSRAFTLVEILVVSMILALVSLAVFSTFSNGIRLYKRMTMETGAVDQAIFLDRFITDLRNSFLFSGLEPSGGEEYFSAPSLVYQPALASRCVGTVRYEFEPDKQQLVRYQSDYSQIYSAAQPSARQRLEGINGARFSFYRLDPEKNEYLWLDEWNLKDEMPLAVRLEFFRGSGEDEKRTVRTVWLPVASALTCNNNTTAEGCIEE